MEDEIEEYIERLDALGVLITKVIDKHADTGTIEIDMLFRAIHSMKATTYYHDFEEISILLEKTEDILFFMRNYDCGCSKTVTKWFLNLVLQIDLWTKQIQNLETPSFYAIEFEYAPSVECAHFSSKQINETVEIVIASHKEQDNILLLDILSSKFKYITTTTTIAETVDLLLTSGKKILISDIRFKDGNIIDIMKCINSIDFDTKNLFILSKFKQQESVDLFKEKLNIANVFNANTIRLSDVKTAIIDLCEDHTGLIEIPINNKISLIELIEYIEPLPQTLIDLKEACFSARTSIKDIVKIIETDPMFSSIILRSINSPYIGLTNRVTKVQIAVSLLGKKQIGTMTIVESAKEGFGDGNLGAYNISLSNAISVSLQRVQFVTEWIKYIDISQDAKDDVTSLIHFIPLGIVITNQAIIHGKYVDKFKSLVGSAKDLKSLEKSLIGFSSLDALEKIFSIWNIHPNLMKILRNVKEFGCNNVSHELETQTHIVILALKLFECNGNFNINKDIIRYAEHRKLAGIDMKNVFLKITNKKPHGNLFNIIDAGDTEVPEDLN